MSRISAEKRLAQARDLSRLYRAVHEFIAKASLRLSGEWTDIMQMAADLCVHMSHDDWLPPDDVRNTYWRSLATAQTLHDHMADGATITAALLYEVSTGRQIPMADLRRMFGDEVLDILRLPRSGRNGDSLQPEPNAVDPSSGLRQSADRLMAAVAVNERAVVLMLVQKLHALRESRAATPEATQELAQSIRRLYAPVCRYMGLYDLATEMDDEALRVSNPGLYAETQSLSARTQAESEHILNTARSALQHQIQKAGIPAVVELRARSTNRLATDRALQAIDPDEPFDVVNMFVLTDNLIDCYRALGPVHMLWRPRQERLRDYIAKPKDNGYQSLHTELVGPNGQPMLVLIRTVHMDQVARFGPDILFRERGNEEAMRSYRVAIRDAIDTLPGLALSDKQANAYYNKQSSMITVFSPKGDQVMLPEGSTALDYAYSVHTVMGNTASEAYVNGVLRQLWTELSPADTVEINCASTTQVQREWLRYAKTAKARRNINHTLAQQSTTPGTDGRSVLSGVLEQRGLTLQDRAVSNAITAVARRMNHNTPDDLYRSIQTVTQAKRVAAAAADWLLAHADAAASHASQPMLFAQFDPITAVRAVCCSPIPGDDLVAQETTPGAYHLHQASCAALSVSQTHQIMTIPAVMPDPGPLNPVQLTIITAGSHFSQNLINHLLGPLGVAIQQCHATHPHPLGCESLITVMVSGHKQLCEVIELLENTKGVLRVERTLGAP